MLNKWVLFSLASLIFRPSQGLIQCPEKLNTSNKTPHPSNFSSLRSSPSVAPPSSACPKAQAPGLHLLHPINQQVLIMALLPKYTQSLITSSHFHCHHPLSPRHHPWSPLPHHHGLLASTLAPLHLLSPCIVSLVTSLTQLSKLEIGVPSETPLSLLPSRSDASCGSSLFSQLPSSRFPSHWTSCWSSQKSCSLSPSLGVDWGPPALVNSCSAHTSSRNLSLTIKTSQVSLPGLPFSPSTHYPTESLSSVSSLPLGCRKPISCFPAHSSTW